MGEDRIFRPSEWKEIIHQMQKEEYKVKMAALLYSGMRYAELQYLYYRAYLFNGDRIQMPAIKAKVRLKNRYIRLNPNGRIAITYFLRDDQELPAHHGWQKNMRRWARQAWVDDKGIGCNAPRFTFEAWLVNTYPEQLSFIALSQGHKKDESFKKHLALPFTNKDKEDMKFYTDGWI